MLSIPLWQTAVNKPSGFRPRRNGTGTAVPSTTDYVKMQSLTASLRISVTCCCLGVGKPAVSNR
ncbi:hypothetical protein EYF80_012319 [Liparis tanakae]|uniref:Uncharacterized protein n=1 Tax=Liparis tanakae TaxID=230148 RepID=A0A4Z2IIH1_9TELE|nr:hypothetical protein EYF80_012319 [Liparis tanakae]